MVAAALYLVYSALNDTDIGRKGQIIRAGAASVLLMFVCSGHESLAVVYVFMTFAILSLQLIQIDRLSLR